MHWRKQKTLRETGVLLWTLSLCYLGMAWLVPMTTNPSMNVWSDESVAACVKTSTVGGMSEHEETDMKHPICSSYPNFPELHERWKKVQLQRCLPLWTELIKKSRGGPDHCGVFTKLTCSGQPGYTHSHRKMQPPFYLLVKIYHWDVAANNVYPLCNSETQPRVK